MAVKTITVTEEAYDALKRVKGPTDSFSTTILRVTGKQSLLDFVGILSQERASRLKKVIRDVGRDQTRMYDEHIRRMKKRMQEVTHGNP